MTDNVSAEAHRCRQAGDFDRYNRTVLAQVFKFANIQEFDHYFYEKHFPDIYPKSVGVIDGYTLQQHTERVVRQFEHHYAECDTLPIAPNFFRGLLYLHDIGKPEACEKAGKHHQHRYTKKILIDFFTQQRLPGVHIALALLTGDPLGKYLKLFQSPSSTEDINADTAACSIRGMADCAPMPVSRFYQALLIYYKCDASSYPTLMKNLFDAKHSGGKDGICFSRLCQQRIDQLERALFR